MGAGLPVRNGVLQYLGLVTGLRARGKWLEAAVYELRRLESISMTCNSLFVGLPLFKSSIPLLNVRAILKVWVTRYFFSAWHLAGFTHTRRYAHLHMHIRIVYTLKRANAHIMHAYLHWLHMSIRAKVNYNTTVLHCAVVICELQEKIMECFNREYQRDLLGKEMLHLQVEWWFVD